MLCAQLVADRIEGKTPALSDALCKAMQCDLDTA